MNQDLTVHVTVILEGLFIDGQGNWCANRFSIPMIEGLTNSFLFLTGISACSVEKLPATEPILVRSSSNRIEVKLEFGLELDRLLDRHLLELGFGRPQEKDPRNLSFLKGAAATVYYSDETALSTISFTEIMELLKKFAELLVSFAPNKLLATLDNQSLDCQVEHIADDGMLSALPVSIRTMLIRMLRLNLKAHCDLSFIWESRLWWLQHYPQEIILERMPLLPVLAGKRKDLPQPAVKF